MKAQPESKDMMMFCGLRGARLIAVLFVDTAFPRVSLRLATLVSHIYKGSDIVFMPDEQSGVTC